MKTAVFLAAVVVLLVDVVASIRVARSSSLSPGQRIAWLLLVWLAPLLGAILAIAMSKEIDTPAPVAGKFGEPPNPGYEPGKTTPWLQ